MRLVISYIFLTIILGGCSNKLVTPIKPTPIPPKAEVVNLGPASELNDKARDDVKDASNEVDKAREDVGDLGSKVDSIEGKVKEMLDNAEGENKKRVEEALLLLKEAKETIVKVSKKLAETTRKLLLAEESNDGVKKALEKQKSVAADQRAEIQTLRRDNETMREGLEEASKNFEQIQKTQLKLEEAKSKKNIYRNILFGVASVVVLYFALPLILRSVKPF